MDFNLRPGVYVVAVSGGVDSVVLLNLLHNKASISRVAPWKLVVAHIDHGIRDDSKDDRLFVLSLAEKYGLQFEFGEGRLGPDASEAAARDARYNFLRNVKNSVGAQAIITAHHEDDLLETAILNMLRGTGRKGLSSLKSTDEIVRPLLGVPKSEIIAYAKSHGLEWREDSTNADIAYRRNYIRHKLLPRFGEEGRRKLRELTGESLRLNIEIDELIAELLGNHASEDELDRRWFISLPHAVAKEVMAAWLRKYNTNFDKKGIERIVAASKTFSPGKIIGVNGEYSIVVNPGRLKLSAGFSSKLGTTILCSKLEMF
jgi:tRNA(Ile)-lysidine synthase